MKTSNILLISIGGLLLSSIFINALALRVKVKNGDYELVTVENGRPPENLESVQVAGTIDSVAIQGQSRATFHIIHSDTFSVQQSLGNPYEISHEGNTLVFKPKEDAFSVNGESAILYIYTPQLTGIYSNGQQDPINIHIKGFKTDKLTIQAALNGNISLQEIEASETVFNLDRTVQVNCGKTSSFGHLSIKAVDRNFIHIDGSRIVSMTTDISAGSRIELSGINQEH